MLFRKQSGELSDEYKKQRDLMYLRNKNDAIAKEKRTNLAALKDKKFTVAANTLEAQKVREDEMAKARLLDQGETARAGMRAANQMAVAKERNKFAGMKYIAPQERYDEKTGMSYMTQPSTYNLEPRQEPAEESTWKAPTGGKLRWGVDAKGNKILTNRISKLPGVFNTNKKKSKYNVRGTSDFLRASTF